MSERAQHDERVTRVPYHCDCSYPGARSPHICCSECGDDWDDCTCGAPDDEDASWMLGEMGAREQEQLMTRVTQPKPLNHAIRSCS